MPSPEKECIQRPLVEQTGNSVRPANRSDDSDIGMEIAGRAAHINRLQNMIAESRALARQADHISHADKFRTMVHTDTAQNDADEELSRPFIVGARNNQGGRSAIRSRASLASPTENLANPETSDIDSTQADTPPKERRIPKISSAPSIKEILDNIEKYRDRDGTVERDFVTKDHMKSISNFCIKNNVIISVRETGSLSLARIEQGAKPKPHTILEKSIKADSLKEFHKDAFEAIEARKDQGDQPDLMPIKIGGVDLDDLLGFVGHWSREKELLGVRVTKKDVIKDPDAHHAGTNETDKKESTVGIHTLQEFISDKESNEPYISLANFYPYKDAMGSEWQQFLYTGDYDIHEIYKHNKALAEGTIEKARLLTGINNEIAADQAIREGKGAPKLPMRKGEITISGSHGTHNTFNGREIRADHLEAAEGSDYAMIQHGDQNGYMMNQILESLKSHDGKIGIVKDKVQLASKVAREDTKIAWCAKGIWYVTHDPDKIIKDPKNPKKEIYLPNPYTQRNELRKSLGIVANTLWTNENQDKIRNGRSPAFQIEGNGPVARLGRIARKKPQETKEGDEPMPRELTKRERRKIWSAAGSNIDVVYTPKEKPRNDE